MTDAALRSRELRAMPEFSSAPRLRLLPKGARTRTDAAEASGSRERAAGRSQERMGAAHANGGAAVLIVGADAATRASVRQELSELMPVGACFEELDTFWELLARAASSRMVILSGDLDELPAESLLRALGHRYPDLPVVSLGSGERG